jgi:hypothetical protein
VVLSAVARRPFETVSAGIRKLAHEMQVLIGGEGGSGELGELLGAQALGQDPVEAPAGMPIRG